MSSGFGFLTLVSINRSEYWKLHVSDYRYVLAVFEAMEKYCSRVFCLESSAEDQAQELKYFLTDVFQVYVWKASKGNCNSHLPFCVLLDKQEKYNNNNGGECSTSSLQLCRL